MEARDFALSPKSQVQNCDVAESNQRLRIANGGLKIECMGNPVGAFSTTGAEDGAHTWVPESIVDVGKPVLIAAGQKVTMLVENMSAKLDS